MPVSKSKQSVLERLGASGNHASDEERAQAFRDAMRWLEERRQQLGISADDPAFKAANEALAEHEEGLNEDWCDADLETFRESLRRYARAGAQEMLRVHKARKETA